MNRNVITIFFIIFILCFHACLPINQDTSIKVVSIKKIIDKNAADYTICSSLNLTKEDVLKYFTHAEQVSDYDFNSEAMILPCKYEGSISIEKNFLSIDLLYK